MGHPIAWCRLPADQQQPAKAASRLSPLRTHQESGVPTARAREHDMGHWKGNSYYDARGEQILSYRSLHDADGRQVHENPMSLIDWFDDFLGRHPYTALSNYHEGEPIELDGHLYATGEHAFQAGKAGTEANRQRIQQATSPDEAKTLGRELEGNPDWDRIRVEHMEKVVRAKFAVERLESRVLVWTGTAQLIEGTLWRDEFWGVDLEKPGRPGKNHLGHLLMKQRSRLQGSR